MAQFSVLSEHMTAVSAVKPLLLIPSKPIKNILFIRVL